jgi:signal recognition particle subunit SRP54
MTKGERSNPSILDGSRRQRIARGSGTTITDVNQVIKQFTEMAKMMKGLAQGKMPGMGQIPGMGQMMKGAPALSGMGGLGGLGLPGAKGALSGLGDLGLDRGALLGGAASGAPSGGGGKGKKKKKGGRVTPPKPR